MSAAVYKINAEGIGPMVENALIPAGDCYRLVSVSCTFNAAPTTSENLVVTLDVNAGATYDVTLYSVDPAAKAATSLLYQPEADLYLEGEDLVKVAYANTDGRTWAVQMTFQGVF